MSLAAPGVVTGSLQLAEVLNAFRLAAYPAVFEVQWVLRHGSLQANQAVVGAPIVSGKTCVQCDGHWEAEACLTRLQSATVPPAGRVVVPKACTTTAIGRSLSAAPDVRFPCATMPQVSKVAEPSAVSPSTATGPWSPSPPLRGTSLQTATPTPPRAQSLQPSRSQVLLPTVLPSSSLGCRQPPASAPSLPIQPVRLATTPVPVAVTEPMQVQQRPKMLEPVATWNQQACEPLQQQHRYPHNHSLHHQNQSHHQHQHPHQQPQSQTQQPSTKPMQWVAGPPRLVRAVSTAAASPRSASHRARSLPSRVASADCCPSSVANLDFQPGGLDGQAGLGAGVGGLGIGVGVGARANGLTSGTFGGPSLISLATTATSVRTMPVASRAPYLPLQATSRASEPVQVCPRSKSVPASDWRSCSRSRPTSVEPAPRVARPHSPHREIGGSAVASPKKSTEGGGIMQCFQGLSPSKRQQHTDFGGPSSLPRDSRSPTRRSASPSSNCFGAGSSKSNYQDRKSPLSPSVRLEGAPKSTLLGSDRLARSGLSSKWTRSPTLNRIEAFRRNVLEAPWPSNQSPSRW